jgi:3'-5' exoribonuclease 1
VLDFECTCDARDDASNPWVHEIIEWPVVLVDARDGTVVDEFHHYIKPQERKSLTPFCTELTGITQTQVDNGLTLAEALEAFQEWLKVRDIGEGRLFSIALATDGPWDFVNFLYPECVRKSLPYPLECSEWVDLRKLYADFHCVRSCNVKKMLAGAGMVFEGRLHSGIDDTRNIARIAIHLLKSGARLGANASIGGTSAHLPWLSDSHSRTATTGPTMAAPPASAASAAAAAPENETRARKTSQVSRIRINTADSSVEGGSTERPPKSPAACLTPRAMREFCDETSSDDDGDGEDSSDAAGPTRSRPRQASSSSTSTLKLDPVSASTSRASSANTEMSAGEMSVRRVANLRTLSLSERERRTEAEMQAARSASQSSQLDEELSTVRKQISLLVQVEGLPITEHPMPDGSPAAPRKGRLNWPTYTPRTHGHTHTHARSMPATGNWLQLATGKERRRGCARIH